MKHLTAEQINHLKKELANSGIIDKNTTQEFLDHVACLVEVKMQKGKGFEKALEELQQNNTKDELSELAKVTSNLIGRKEITMKITYQHGLIGGFALCIWVFVEYLTGTWLGVPELGPFYGLLSMVILSVMVGKGIQRLHRAMGRIRISFWHTFKSGMRLVFISSLVVLVFMLFYIGFLNTEFYGIYDENQPIDRNTISVVIVLSMWLGVLLEGGIIAAIVGVLSRKRRSI